MLNSVSIVFKTSLSAQLMQVKLLLFTYLNGRLHAVSVRKPCERVSNFWTVRLLKAKSELIVHRFYSYFPHRIDWIVRFIVCLVKAVGRPF